MKKLFFFFLFLTSWYVLHAQGVRSMFILTSAKVDINGTTNVNKFNCSLHESNLSDTLYLAGEWEGNTIVLDGLDLKLTVNKFDCGIKLMTNDFRKIMMSETYPDILLKINRLVVTSEMKRDSTYSVSTEALFSIAKATRREDIKNGALRNLHDKQVISGSHHVKMTSFGLTPPTKFFGTVKVADELSLEFELVLEHQ